MLLSFRHSHICVKAVTEEETQMGAVSIQGTLRAVASLSLQEANKMTGDRRDAHGNANHKAVV